MPAIVMNGRLDLLSANRLGYALYSPVYEDYPARPVNLAAYSPEPDSSSQDAVALLASWAATLDDRQRDTSQPPADQR